METNIDFNKAFELFVSTDDYRANISVPFKQNGVYYATDAHAMIIMPVGLVKLDYSEQEMPKLDSIIPKENCNIMINISELEAKLIPEMIDEIIEDKKEDRCNECNGDGEVEFEYDASNGIHYIDADCPVCEGTGKIETKSKKNTGKKIINPDKIYRIFGVFYMYKQLKRLIDACHILGVEEITQIYNATNNGNLFACGSVKILIMPAFTTNENEITVIF